MKILYLCALVALLHVATARSYERRTVDPEDESSDAMEYERRAVDAVESGEDSAGVEDYERRMEERAAVAIAKTVVQVGMELAPVANDIINKLKSGNKIKSDFTDKFVKMAAQKYPGFAVAIVHSATTKGRAAHHHVEVPLGLFGRTYGYEVYVAKPGTPFELWRQGDGGYINWAFTGPWKRNDNHLWVK